MTKDLERKIEQSIKIVKTACASHEYVIAFSGGKDSVCLDWICKQAGYDLLKVYNATTIDPPKTISFCKYEYQAEIRMPRYTFLDLVEKKGYPTMFRRFCCKYLKESFIAKYVMTGVRKAESVARSKRYCDFESARKFSSGLYSTFLHPLLLFTTEDIQTVVDEFALKCHPLYYDAEGNFCANRRLGCIGCPLQSDKGKADYLQYPKLLRSVAVRLIRYHLNHGRTKEDAYENLVYVLFYSDKPYEVYASAFKGLFPSNAKTMLENYFSIELP